jgi:hypothetical protein
MIDRAREHREYAPENGAGGQFMTSTKERMIGTWRLVTTVIEDLSTGEKTNPWGGDALGYINYGPDGRMIVINARSGRDKPQGPVPTDAEAADLFKSMLAYAGTYTVDGDVVTHHVDISWNEAWTGTRQVRKARFDGNRVHLSADPALDVASGKMSVRTITWEKLAREGDR